MRNTIGKFLHTLNVITVYAVLILFIPVIVIACVGEGGFNSFMAFIQIPFTYQVFRIFAYSCLGISIVTYFIHETFFAK